jgi:hypothetical protein
VDEISIWKCSNASFGEPVSEEYTGEPYVIVDIRGNTGGNDVRPKRWIARFTGRNPSLKHVFTALTSKTTMVARVNVFERMLATYSEEDAAGFKGKSITTSLGATRRRKSL